MSVNYHAVQSAHPLRDACRSVAHAFGAVAAVYLRWADRIRERQHLEQLDDRLLRDVGLTRHDLGRIVHRPFWQ